MRKKSKNKVEPTEGSSVELLAASITNSEAALQDLSLFNSHATTDFELLYWRVFGGEAGVSFSPEERLMLAMLVQALEDLVSVRKVSKYKNSINWLREDAHKWFAETTYVDSMGRKERGLSLETVCEALDLTVSVVKKAAMRKMKEGE